MAPTDGPPDSVKLRTMSQLVPEFFRRLDERPDALFYQRPRTASHIDDAACAAVRSFHDELLPAGGRVLDLMAGVRSHLSARYGHVVGLGMNADELHANLSVDTVVIHDLNRDVELPFAPASFDGVVCTVSVQYMTRPVATFASVARLLVPGAPFVVAISRRMFEQKAVLAWRASDDAAHLRLVRTYFTEAPGFGPVEERHHEPPHGDPLHVLWARRRCGS
jgi:SAM-dependent methyltransferase